ncbi:MAG: hypothetical protein WC656_01375 [Sulfurimonas sp.]|jgi:hypothetical protein
MKATILGHSIVIKDLDTEITDNNIEEICHHILIGANEGFITQNDRSFYWKIEPSVSTSENIMADYQIWWEREGSGMIPTAEEDTEEFVNRVSKIAWSNGSYKTSENAYLSQKVAILEEKNEVVFEHEQMIYKIWSCEDGYMYDCFCLSEFSSGEELESEDGGCCTGTAHDAVFMAIEE